MADEQNTVPINDESPYAEAEQAAGNTPQPPVSPFEATAPTMPAAEPAAAEGAVAPQDISGFDSPQVTYYGSQPAAPAAPADPTLAVDAVPAAASAADPTASMPNPYPASQPTAPMPTADPFGAPSAGQAAPIPPVVPPAPTFAGARTPVPPATGAYSNAVSTPVYTPDQVYGTVNQLSGGLKFGWLLIGLLLGIPGMLIAWLTNADKHPQVKKDAILWSVIGFAINVVFAIIATVAMVGILAAAANGYGSYYGTPF